MHRRVQPELLDTLSPDDPRAVCSRRDLRRINWWMQNPITMADALQTHLASAPRLHITELGAGDGKFLLTAAQKLAPRWPDTDATLLDLQETVSAETLAGFARLGWRANAVVADVFHWHVKETEVVVANLFLHHFEDERLTLLLQKIAERAKLFVALEPRRDPWPLFGSRLLWAIGCNDVTRHDAVVSVRAGFSGRELSSLWPDQANWRLTEHAAGMFSHLFIARKKD